MAQTSEFCVMQTKKTRALSNDLALAAGRTAVLLREATGVSQAAIAKRLGIARRNYARFEAGDHEPMLSTIVRLANAHQFSAAYVVSLMLGAAQPPLKIGAECVVDNEYEDEVVIVHPCVAVDGSEAYTCRDKSGRTQTIRRSNLRPRSSFPTKKKRP